MSGNQGPRLAIEWENLLAPLRLYQSQNNEQGSLPFISPYCTDMHPEHLGSSDAHHHSIDARSLYVGHQYMQMFDKNGWNQSYGSPTQSTEAIKQSTSSAVARYRANLAAVNGIMVPSRRPHGKKPLKPSGTPLNTIDYPVNHSCPICGTKYARKIEVATHFVACVGRNGNPESRCWDEESSMARQTTKSQQSQQANARARTSRISQRDLRRSRGQESERTRYMIDKLNAVNGVVIPSRLAAGEVPEILPSHAKPSTPLRFACPLCQGPFARKDHVRSHFPACVERNGNPDGLRWND